MQSKKTTDDWRIYTFAEGGGLSIYEPLPEQQSGFLLGSIGIGTRFRIDQYFNGSFDAGLPLTAGPNTDMFRMLLTFRIWAEF